MARLRTHVGRARRIRLTTGGSGAALSPFNDPALFASSRSVAEHEGRVPQPGVPSGPRNTPSASAHYHGDMSIPGYHPKTPTTAPPAGEAATAPAGNYAGAGREFSHALAALPPPVRLATLASPHLSVGLGGPLSALANPTSAASALLQQLLGGSGPTEPQVPLRARRVLAVYEEALSQGHPKRASQAEQTLASLGYALPKSLAGGGAPRFLPPGVKPLPESARGAATASDPNPATAVISSRPSGIKPGDPLAPGKGTAAKQQAIADLLHAQHRVANSGANIQHLHSLYPEIPVPTLRAYRAAARRTGVPPQLLAGIESQESGYGTSTLPGVRSGQNSAGAAGPFQIGNGTGAAGDWWGEHMPPGANIYNDRTAAIGAGKYLTEAGATKDPSTWYDAALAYNHADWYAQEAVRIAKEHGSLAGLANPVDPAARASLAEAKADARAVGVDPEAILGKARTGLGPVPPQVMSRFHAGLKAAKALAAAHIPYVWGGGHQGFTTASGLDCSGAVSFVLHAMGVLETPLSSGEMGNVLEPGPGAITVYYNSGHTFMKIGNKYFGTSVGNSSKGLAFYGAPSQEYLSQYNVGHVPGLGKKVALQLGISPSELTGSPGMTLGTGGTTATINPGAGATIEGGAQYSNRPIQLVSLTSPLSAGPVMPSDLLSPEDHASAAQETMASLLGEELPTVTRRPTLG